MQTLHVVCTRIVSIYINTKFVNTILTQMSAAIAVSYNFVQFPIPPCLRGNIAARAKLILFMTVWNVYPVHDVIPRIRMRARLA